MQAYRLFNWQSPARLVDIPIPEPGPGEVLLKVGGNGICQSDLHTMHEWTESPPHLNIELPMTIGHEIGGWVHQLGPGVTGIEIGQPCVVTIAGCGHCRSCVRGWNNYCENLGKQPGMGFDGGLAEYVVAPVAGIVPLGSLTPWQAAPLTDAGLSSYHAVKRILPLLTPGSTIVVVGIGGLGHMAVATLKAVSPARIIAVDTSDKALELATQLGADDCVHVDVSKSSTAVMAGITERVDAVLDFVGAGSTIEMAAQIIRPMGHCCGWPRSGGLGFSPQGYALWRHDKHNLRWQPGRVNGANFPGREWRY